MEKELAKLLRPQAVAIVGASSREGSVAGTILRNLRACGFAGDIYPVNPKYKTVLGFTCYPSIDQVPELTDLAILAINRNLVLQAVEKCGKRGIRNLVIITAGLRKREQEANAWRFPCAN